MISCKAAITLQQLETMKRPKDIIAVVVNELRGQIYPIEDYQTFCWEDSGILIICLTAMTGEDEDDGMPPLFS